MGRAALLLIDLVNPLDFEGGDALLRHAHPMARRIAELQRRTREAEIPTVYVNDNFDAWHLGFRELACVVPLLGLSLFLGVYPKPVIDRVEPSVRGILCHVQANSDYEEPATAYPRNWGLTVGTESRGIVSRDCVDQYVEASQR